MQEASPADLVRDQILRLWGEGDLSIVDRNYAPEVIDHMPAPGQAQGLEALKQVVREFRAAIPDLRMHLHGVIGSRDMACDLWTLEGVHAGPLFGLAPTGRPVRFSGIDMVRVSDGKIRDIWHVEEMAHFFFQIGAGPSPHLEEAPETGAASADRLVEATLPDPTVPGAAGARALTAARLLTEGEVKPFTAMCAPKLVAGRPRALHLHSTLRAAAPDLQTVAKQYISDGNLAASRWVMRGTHTAAPLWECPARGRAFTINGMNVVGIGDDGLVRDLWHVEELASLRAQVAP